METLEYNNKEIKFLDLPKGVEKVKVVVEENLHDRTIDLTYKSCAISLTVDGARELALSLRQAANKIKQVTREKQWIK